MSDNFRGITFAEQTVTPADDAIFRRAVLPDGILTGCEISYSGSTLTMAAGHIIACGRSFQHITAENFAVVDATSGFARLVLTIDLTKTATESAFDQIDSSIEYAAAEDGFVELDQEDINLSGTRYQIVACVVSLGTGGITGIVSQMEKSEPGAGLNFKVVGGETQPSDPKENTIWVNTSVKITSWIFSAAEPAEPSEGMVWITIGAASTVEFNALKKNGIQVYPLSAKQYVSGAWVDVTAMSYQGGAWTEWVRSIAINEEEWNKTLPYPELSYSYGTYYFSDGALQGYITGSLKAVTVVTKELIDFSDINQVKFLYDLSTALGASGHLLAVVSSSKTSANEEYIIGELLIKTAATNKAAVLDVSGITGKYYLWLGLAVWEDIGTVSFEISDLEFV